MDKDALGGGKVAESSAESNAVLLCFNDWSLTENLADTSSADLSLGAGSDSKTGVV